MQILISDKEINIIRQNIPIVVYLLTLVNQTKNKEVFITFDKLARVGKYTNRSGAWKFIKKLESKGLVTTTGRNKILVNIPIII